MKVKGKLKEACECSEEKERKQRVDKVTSILEGIYENEKDKQEAILSFCKSAMTIPEIEFIASTMKPEYLSNKDTYVNLQVRKVGVW